jgi:hypothetical protein
MGGFWVWGVELMHPPPVRPDPALSPSAVLLLSDREA